MWYVFNLHTVHILSQVVFDPDQTSHEPQIYVATINIQSLIDKWVINPYHFITLVCGETNMVQTLLNCGLYDIQYNKD